MHMEELVNLALCIPATRYSYVFALDERSTLGDIVAFDNHSIGDCTAEGKSRDSDGSRSLHVCVECFNISLASAEEERRV